MAPDASTTKLDPRKLAAAYRCLVLWFGAELALTALSFGLEAVSPGSVVGVVVMVGFWVIAVALAYYGYRTSAALGSGVAWLWGIAMFIPLVNIVSLLLLSSRSTKACAAQGIPVGLLGPRLP